MSRAKAGEDHNATSYSTETHSKARRASRRSAKIITLRAIALKRQGDRLCTTGAVVAKIITLRAIALKLQVIFRSLFDRLRAKIITLRAIALKLTETGAVSTATAAKIITLRAIALKPSRHPAEAVFHSGEDHNATSYSTETAE